MMEDPRDIAARTYQAALVAKPGEISTDELKNTLEQYKLFRDSGGLSAENIERMRGLGGFDEFSKTGGYTPEAIANIKAQAISPIGAYATGTREELDRRRALQGGYAPGFDAANRALQRDTARNIGNTALAANVALQDRINAGRQWGISGLTAAESNLAGMQTGNRLSALGGETGVGTNISGFRGQDIRNALEAEMFNAQASNQAAASNAQAEYMADLYNQQNQQAQYAAGLGGLGGLYEGDIRQQQAEYDRQLALLNSQNAAMSGYFGTQAGLATQPGIGSGIMQGVGTGAGIAADYWGGGYRNF